MCSLKIVMGFAVAALALGACGTRQLSDEAGGPIGVWPRFLLRRRPRILRSILRRVGVGVRCGLLE